MDPAASPDQLVALAAALEASWLGTAMRDSTVLYPVVNIMHLIGLVLVVGGIGLLDLRFLGAAHHVRLADLYLPLTAAAALGVGLQIGTGFPLFASDATALVGNVAFKLKMLLFVLALTNAILFRLLWSRRVADWDRDPPFLGLAQAALSLMLWVTIAALGRLIAYV
jgi:hypothetical protein